VFMNPPPIRNDRGFRDAVPIAQDVNRQTQYEAPLAQADRRRAQQAAADYSRTTAGQVSDYTKAAGQDMSGYDPMSPAPQNDAMRLAGLAAMPEYRVLGVGDVGLLANSEKAGLNANRIDAINRMLDSQAAQYGDGPDAPKDLEEWGKRDREFARGKTASDRFYREAKIGIEIKTQANVDAAVAAGGRETILRSDKSTLQTEFPEALDTSPQQGTIPPEVMQKMLLDAGIPYAVGEGLKRQVEMLNLSQKESQQKPFTQQLEWYQGFAKETYALINQLEKSIHDLEGFAKQFRDDLDPQAQKWIDERLAYLQRTQLSRLSTWNNLAEKFLRNDMDTISSQQVTDKGRFIKPELREQLIREYQETSNLLDKNPDSKLLEYQKQVLSMQTGRSNTTRIPAASTTKPRE
jgi:hypothetical protein